MSAPDPSGPTRLPARPPAPTTTGGLRRRVFECLESARSGDRASRLTDLVVLLMIVANVFVVILESTEPIDRPLPLFYEAFEAVSVAFFSVEYLLRLWSVVEHPRFAHPLLGRLRWVVTPLALVDLFAILPTFVVWLGLAQGVDLRVMRCLRLIRIFRLAKLGRYSTALTTFVLVLRERRGELGTSMFLLAVLLLVSSSLMYSIENTAQPGAFSSIPHAMWWAVATLTTVGYGDVYPITAAGKLLGAVIAVLGIGMFALPAGILGAAFSEALERQRRRRHSTAPRGTHHCPHCGEPIDGDADT